MIEFLNNLFLKFSFISSYPEINEKLTDSNALPVLFMIFVGVYLIGNIAHFLDSEINGRPLITFLGVLSYCIVNVIFLTIVTLIGLSIFSYYGFFIIVIILSVILVIAASANEDGEDASLFRLLPYTKEYIGLISRYISYKKKTKKDYNEFLNLKY